MTRRRETWELSIVRVILNDPRDIERATAMIIRERADALLIDTTLVNFTLRKEFAEFAVQERMPSIVNTSYSDAGLMSYGHDYPDMWRRGATYVARILSGTKPADLPIEQPTKVELIINLKMARAIGLTIPQSLLLRADEVIQ
jgi:putative ABC transport system substrate-binding protein